MRALTSVAVLTLASSAAWAQERENTKQSYPQSLVARPVILPKGMVELTLGGQSDFVAATSADAIRTIFDISYGFANRLEAGFQSDVQVLPGDDFEFEDLHLWGQYNLAPWLNFRVGGYMNLLRDPTSGDLGDAVFGVRAGLPMKGKLSPSFAVVFMPTYGSDVSGPKVQRLELPLIFQIQLVSQLALFAGASFEVTEWTFENANIFMPVRGGVLLSPARLFDIGAEFRIDDVTDSGGRDSRWVLAWLGIRR
jgi:hypothetical protein